MKELKIDKLVRDILIAAVSFIASCWILHWLTIDSEHSTQMMGVVTAVVILITCITVIGVLHDKGHYDQRDY